MRSRAQKAEEVSEKKYKVNFETYNAQNSYGNICFK